MYHTTLFFEVLTTKYQHLHHEFTRMKHAHFYILHSRSNIFGITSSDTARVSFMYLLTSRGTMASNI